MWWSLELKHQCEAIIRRSGVEELQVIVFPGICQSQTSRTKQPALLSGAEITSEGQFMCFSPSSLNRNTKFQKSHKSICFAQCDFQKSNWYFFSSLWDGVILGLLPMWNCTVFTIVVSLVLQFAGKSWHCSKAAASHFWCDYKTWKWPLCQVSPKCNSVLATLQLTLYSLTLPKFRQTFFVAFFLSF